MSRLTVNLAVVGGSAAMLAAAFAGIARADGYLGTSATDAATEPSPEAIAQLFAEAAAPVEEWTPPAAVAVSLGQLPPADPIRLSPMPALTLPETSAIDPASIAVSAPSVGAIRISVGASPAGSTLVAPPPSGSTSTTRSSRAS